MSTLAELLETDSSPVGCTSGTGEWFGRRIARGSAGLAERVTLDAPGVVRALTCEGWWVAEGDVEGAGASPSGLADARARGVARCWVAARSRGLGLEPAPLAAAVARGVAQRWNAPGLDGRLGRLRVDAEEWFAALDDDWPTAGTGGRLEMPRASWAVRAGRVDLVPGDMDVAVGHGRSEGGLVWAGTTLLAFTANEPSVARLDELGLAALVHGLRTGCPARRVVLWGLSSRSGLGRDVDPAWLERWSDDVVEATRRIAGVQSWFAPTLVSGGHCSGCSRYSVCPAVNPSERAW